MQTTKETFYALTNYQRDQVFNHKLMQWNDYSKIFTHMNDYLIPNNDQLEILIDKLRDIPKYKGHIERGIVIEKVTVNLDFKTLMGVEA